MHSKPSKTTKRRSAPPFTRTFAESEISSVARELLDFLRARSVEQSQDRLKSHPVVVAFNGPMGAGKSTLIRACLEILSAEGDYKGSPTYALAHEYETALGRVAHMDWYRIESSEELESMGMREYLSRSYAVLFVEWADRFPEWLENEKDLVRVDMTLGKISVS